MPPRRDQSAGEKTLGIIRQPAFGVTDRGSVALSFSVYVTESSAALQVLGVDQAVDVIRAYGVHDVRELEGKPCWVRCSANLIEWLGPWTR